MTWIIKNPICAVYKIVCAANGKIYIGSTTNLAFRWCQHKSDLRHNHHNNDHLQCAWNKYGAAVFSFDIIEKCSEDVLIDREQHWINELNVSDRRFGFNKTSVAGKSYARGMKFSDATLEVLRIKSSRRYVVVDPDGQESPVVNLKAFCADNGLRVEKMRHVASGRYCHHLGWRCRRVADSESDWIRLVIAAGLPLRLYEFVSPGGIRFRVSDIAGFAKRHSLDRAALNRVIAGSTSNWNGWTGSRIASNQ